MTTDEADQEDDEVIRMAEEALSAAQLRALASGRPVVIVVDDELVRVSNGETTVLKKLPQRRKVTAHFKRTSE